MSPDFFGTEDEIAQGDAVTQAWALRQRDPARALSLLRDAPAGGRAELVRAELAWLAQGVEAAAGPLAAARATFAAEGDEIGLGDADLLEASLLDQAGGRQDVAVRRAQERFERAGDVGRARLAATWIACVESTADPRAAQERWGALLDDAQAAGPGLRTYVEGARATLAWQRGDVGEAIAAFQRAHHAACASGQIVSAVTTGLNTGIACATLHDDESALAWAERAQDLVRPRGWPYLTAWCLMQTGSILLGMGRAQAAQDLLLEGLPAFAGCEGSRNHVLALQILGEACLELSQDAPARTWCEQAVQGARRLPYPDLVSGSLRYLALARSRQDDVEGALSAAAEALAVAEAQSDWPRIATIHHVLAEIARRHGRPGRPAMHLGAAFAAGARMAGWEAPAEWLAAWSADLEAEGDLAGALQREREASAAARQADRRRAEEKATAMGVRHRLEQAQAEADRQRVMAEANRLRAELLETRAALEQERTQSLLVHAGKMVAIGRLASGVVHEMSHPVGTLLLVAESLAERLASGPAELSMPLGTLVAEARRLQQLVVRLRDFARAEPPQLARHDLRAVHADARQLFAPRLAVLRVDFEEDVPSVPVVVDPQRLALALANLVLNAADAMAGAAVRRLHLHVEISRGQLRLHVDDSGPGVPAEVLPHLFEPFFTTKPAGQGLGLGLALSAESLASMHGRIEVSNRAEGGARFTIMLPLAETGPHDAGQRPDRAA